MADIYLNENEVGGPAKSIAYPNVITCVSATAVLANATMVGAHLTKAADVEGMAKRMMEKIGSQPISRIYLVGGYGYPGNLHGAGAMAHARLIAATFGFHGSIYSYDTVALRHAGVMVQLDLPHVNGTARVLYKNWAKLSKLGGRGPNPYGGKVMIPPTVGVVRKPKGSCCWRDPNPALIFHEVLPMEFKHFVWRPAVPSASGLSLTMTTTTPASTTMTSA